MNTVQENITTGTFFPVQQLHGLNGNMLVSPGQWKRAKQMSRERLRHKPIQYVIGEWNFRDCLLHMRQPVLIPRPETEASL